MGSPDTLSDFIDYTLSEFPADHYALILWNHGGGARKKTVRNNNSGLTKKAICQDAESGDILYLDEVQQAVSNHFNTDFKLDIIGFDACLMSTLEVAYEFRSLAEYMVGSMSYIQDDGWPYDRIVNAMGSSTLSGRDFSALIVSEYKVYIDSVYQNQQTVETISATDLSEITGLADAVNILGKQIYNESDKNSIESVREQTIPFYNISSLQDSIYYPYYDLAQVRHIKM